MVTLTCETTLSIHVCSATVYHCYTDHQSKAELLPRIIKHMLGDGRKELVQNDELVNWSNHCQQKTYSLIVCWKREEDGWIDGNIVQYT